MATEKLKEKQLPPQHQDDQPGKEYEMHPRPESTPIHSKTGKLQDKTVIITGGDSGIGKATALLMAEEGANLVLVYLDEHIDANTTAAIIEKKGRNVLLISGDISEESFCRSIVIQALKRFGRIDVVINNAAIHYPQDKPENITADQLIKTFSTNVFGAFYLTIAALPHLKEGSSIISTTSVTAYRGSDHLVDYAATKSALVGFTRSLSAALAPRKIRVNAVAPGPIWTPLIPASFTKEEVAKFGTDTPMKRPGQPNEVATCFLFLASEDSSYMTGQVLHPNGGEIING